MEEEVKWIFDKINRSWPKDAIKGEFLKEFDRYSPVEFLGWWDE